ncbi:MAG: hypothetical protein AAGL49_00245, partial [Pseudomonadota bacterium]
MADIDLVPNDSCPTGTTLEEIGASPSVQACVLRGDLTSDIVLTAENGYALDGAVFVGTDTGDGGVAASLTIPAGVTLFGAAGEDYLVVARGSTIDATGTAANPITMTSIQDVIDMETSGGRDTTNVRGEWGGLVINGFAPINNCEDASATPGGADCFDLGEGASGRFGGDDPNDDSGVLNYVVVKFAGNLINSEDELNGIAFQGVGDATNVEFVQVHNNADDAFEWFGGTVNAKYLVATGAGDDSLDWTDGWTGSVQYAVVKQGPTVLSDDPRGIEADNRNGNELLTPTSN